MPLRSALPRAARVFAGCGLSLAVCGVMAFWTATPWLFPSLGPTAFLQFAAPGAATNHPRRVLGGHAVAIASGALALLACGLWTAPSCFVTGVDLPRIAAATLALAATGGLMVLLDVEHPPAGATTLIVALGLLHEPRDLGIIMAAVLVLVLACTALRPLARAG